MTAKSGKQWLVLSHAFNMDGRAASHTITDKIPHLVAAGIQPIIVSAMTGRQDTQLEHYQLLPIGPVGLRFDLRHILSQRWGKGIAYRLVMLMTTLLLAPGIMVEKLCWRRESQWSWWWSAYRKGLQLIRAGKVDVIYSTGGAYAAHIAAAKLKQKTGLPWIAEVHDPLVKPESIPKTDQEKTQAEVERLICTEADYPFWFTDQALVSAKLRHPQLGERGFVILPGADAPKMALPTYHATDKMVIGHFGSLSPTRHLATVIQAIALLPVDIRQHIELQVYGSGLDSCTDAAITKYTDKVTVRHFGRLEYDTISSKSGRQQVLERMRTVDVLLLQHGIEPMCAEYIPSKLYEYFWMQRPILGLVYSNLQLARMLKDMGHTVVAANDVDEQAEKIHEFYQQWLGQGLLDLDKKSPYTNKDAVLEIIKHVSI